MPNKTFGFRGSMIITILVGIVWFFASYIKSIHMIIVYATFCLLIVLALVTIFRSYHYLKTDWKELQDKTKLKIYNLVLTMIGISSVCLIGVWKCYSASINLFSSSYLAFIVIVLSVSMSIVDDELAQLLPKSN